jgi:hypothetical protein
MYFKRLLEFKSLKALIQNQIWENIAVKLDLSKVAWMALCGGIHTFLRARGHKHYIINRNMVYTMPISPCANSFRPKEVLGALDLDGWLTGAQDLGSPPMVTRLVRSLGLIRLKKQIWDSRRLGGVVTGVRRLGFDGPQWVALGRRWEGEGRWRSARETRGTGLEK